MAISEKKLAYYEYLSSKADEATAKAIEQLIAEFRRLAKLAGEHFAQAVRRDEEADYLAEIVASLHGCCVDGVEGDCDKKPDPFYEMPCVRCWREYTRKAVQND